MRCLRSRRSPDIIWWVWRSWLARQIVALEAVGSSPTIHPNAFPRKQCVCGAFFFTKLQCYKSVSAQVTKYVFLRAERIDLPELAIKFLKSQDFVAIYQSPLFYFS